ncbi:N2,N2-dimethylguanosine tRNA methyltransferase [Methanocaldococcus bathoardescens]|uniref:tRNA (guanine(26)-N(2))-dimethyltransferase n=1 Tax=Methanocaldococcus bathoardescens TaxID=1301915 RepID=A0A076LKJ4_9EURY|nr:tRNA (guanine(10)-N(2))-dimethyltransferase [Methanocaldococcus bathoardescens]AIJ06124.1 N2,N2-dimethylguanosine tRNA methyltransferase [Methanocaldococcus bathoardescens]
MILKEGDVVFEVPDKLTVTKKDEVFYNPRMKTGRDISVVIVQAFLNLYHKKDKFYVCDALAGSGIRGLRYAKELKFDGELKVFLNDINPKAYEKIINNAKLNEIENIEVFNEDANTFLSRHFRFFNVVDLDPFGSPAPYIDQAIRALVTRNGLLCLTATDTAALCGRAKKSCLRKYLAYPLFGRDCHEFALRVLVGYAMRMATKYELALKPVFCHATDHYVRVYLVTDRGAKRADKVFEMLGYVKDVNGVKIIRKFEEGYEKGFSGPLYIGNLYDKALVEEALRIAEERKCSERVLKILNAIKGESAINQVGCYDTHQIGKMLKISVPPMQDIINKLKEMGFEATVTHYNPKGIKTNTTLKNVIEAMYKCANIR